MESSPFIALYITSAVLVPFLVWMLAAGTVDNLHHQITSLEEKLIKKMEETEELQEKLEETEEKLKNLHEVLKNALEFD
jgi:predicted nuclease with TOPRIM domain